MTPRSDRDEIYKVDLHLTEKNDVRTIAYDYLAENSTVLDVGCACGDFGKLIYKKKCNVYGMEQNINSINIALKTNVYQIIHEINLNEFDENEFKQYCNYFDSIVLLDILEHLLNPERVLSYLTNFLKKKGELIISFPNVSFCDIKLGLFKNNFTYTDTGILDKTHIKFYTYKSIAKMMAGLGLEISECKPKVAYFTQNKIKNSPLIKHFIKKDPHSFVYQYVIKVHPSFKNTMELDKMNTDKMNLSWRSISFELNKIKRIRLLQLIFPPESFQYMVTKKIKKHLNI